MGREFGDGCFVDFMKTQSEERKAELREYLALPKDEQVRSLNEALAGIRADIDETLSRHLLKEVGHEMPNDPWGNRSEGMKCKTCRFHVLKERSAPAQQGDQVMRNYGTGTHVKPADPVRDGIGVRRPLEWPEVTAKHLGRCRRRAPTMSGYPAVFEDDWCGDHKVDENKI